MPRESVQDFWIQESVKTQTFEDIYEIGKVLGKGATSCVYKCEHRGTGQAWAAKVINKRVDKKVVRTEIGILLKLSHPNVIRMKEIFETPTQINLVLELVTGGELFDRIVSRGVYTEKDAAAAIKDILEGVQHLHKMGVVHRDLKVDYTLWPFWVDRQMNIEPPFKAVDNGKVYDATGREVKSFPDITILMERIKCEGYKIGIASEAFMKEEVAKLVRLFGWDEFIDYEEIYPGSKIFHFVNIKRRSGIDFPDMLFFDDEKEQLDEVAGTCTGITTVWADRGVSEELFEEALQQFAENRQSNTFFRSKPVTISRRNSTEPFVSLRPLINMKRRNSIEAQQNAAELFKPSQLNKGLPGLGSGYKPRRRFSIM